MHLTAVFKLRANHHDARLLRVALRRWHAAYTEALDRARADRKSLLRCLKVWTSRDGGTSRLVVDGAAVHALAVSYVTPLNSRLHSSATASLVVPVEKQLRAWLAQYAAWAASGRKTPKPRFPSAPPGSVRDAVLRWRRALAGSADVVTLPQEKSWSAEVQRAARSRLLPMYFGAATSGVKHQAHCGLLRRPDGKYFALLTLWPRNDPLGTTISPAGNRRDRGDLTNLRAAPEDRPFTPGPRARSSILCPLEIHRGHRSLFFRRAHPRCAQLVAGADGFYLHVTFEFPDHPPRPATGSVLAVRRGVATLCAASVLSSDGRLLHDEELSGGDLARLVTRIHAERAVRQQRGRSTRGERRASRVAEHHLYSAAHQLVDLACRYGAEIVLFDDSTVRRSGQFLRWRHFRRLVEILHHLCEEAGLPPPREKRIYGSWNLCLCCGSMPDDTMAGAGAAAVAAVDSTAVTAAAEEDCCRSCGAKRDSQFHLSRLLALDTLRLRLPDDGRPTLAHYLRSGAYHA